MNPNNNGITRPGFLNQAPTLFLWAQRTVPEGSMQPSSMCDTGPTSYIEESLQCELIYYG